SRLSSGGQAPSSKVSSSPVQTTPESPVSLLARSAHLARLSVAALGIVGITTAPAFAQGTGIMMRSAEHDYRVVVVAGGLVNPWSMAFLPGGDMLVTERPGRLRIIRGGRLLPDPVPGLPEV